jgi:hypothetical protein
MISIVMEIICIAVLILASLVTGTLTPGLKLSNPLQQILAELEDKESHPLSCFNKQYKNTLVLYLLWIALPRFETISSWLGLASKKSVSLPQQKLSLPRQILNPQNKRHYNKGNRHYSKNCQIFGMFYQLHLLY